MRPQQQIETTARGAAGSTSSSEPCVDFRSLAAYRTAIDALNQWDEFTYTDRLVARCILDHVNEIGVAFPSLRRLAKNAGFATKEAVRRSVARLEAAGKNPEATFWITVDTNHRNTYQVFYRPTVGKHRRKPDFSAGTDLTPEELQDVELIRGLYNAARFKRHGIETFSGRDPKDWRPILKWADLLAAIVGRPELPPLLAKRRGLGLAFEAWMQMPGRTSAAHPAGNLQGERHPLGWLVYDLDALTAEVRTRARVAHELRAERGRAGGAPTAEERERNREEARNSREVFQKLLAGLVEPKSQGAAA